MSGPGSQPEHARQQALLAALWRRQPDESLGSLLQSGPLQARGLQAYRANAGANAERALAADFPVVQALVGAEAFAALARACWSTCAPAKGDMRWFGDALPGFIETEPPLADLPYLADVARLEALLARAESAADVQASPHSFERLADEEPGRLRFVLAPGFAVLRSAYPVVTLWRAHQPHEDAQALFGSAQAALQDGEGETALVWRQDWKGRVHAMDAPDAAWAEALQSGISLGEALARPPESFNFEPWLLQALPNGWVLGVQVM